jgi:hypothetical protein
MDACLAVALGSASLGLARASHSVSVHRHSAMIHPKAVSHVSPPYSQSLRSWSRGLNSLYIAQATHCHLVAPS